MSDVIRVNERPVIDYMARDYDSLLQAMRALVPSKLPEWTDFANEADFGNVLLELFAHMGDILSYYQDSVANESFLGTAVSRRSVIEHLRLIGYKLATAAPASAVLHLTVPADCVEVIEISRGDAFVTKSARNKPSIRFEYTRETPLQIDCSTLPKQKDKKFKFFDGIPVEEGRLVEDETLGQSDGKPGQTFQLARPRLILRSLGQAQAVNRDIIVRTELGQGPSKIIEEWALQDSLAFSREGQRDFVIELDEEDRATIIFGDGAFGAIPPQNAVIKATYRVGGGKQGNVPADSIQIIVDAPQLALLGAKVTNPLSATGGSERETISHAVQHAPTVFRSLKRAVTADDYNALALDFKGVGKVRAEVTSWNVVNLFVAPEGGGQVSDVLRANLIAYFEDKRPITTLVEVQNVDYVKIHVTAEIGVEGYYATEGVTEQVQAAGRNLLAFENVDFGETIYISKFYEAIEAVEGVQFVNISEFRRSDGRTQDTLASGKIELGINEIPRVPDDPEDGPDYARGIRVIIPDEGV